MYSIINNQPDNSVKNLGKLNNALLLAFIMLFINTFSIFSAEKADFKVIESSEKYIILEYTAPKAEFKDITGEEGQKYSIPIIPGTYPEVLPERKPMKLIATASIAVPGPNQFKLEYRKISSVITYNNLIAPVPVLFEENGLPVEKFTHSEADYQVQNDEFVLVKYVGIAGDRHVAHVQVNAAVWDGNNKKIQQPEKILVRISFSDNTNSSEIGRKFPLNEFVKRGILNYNQTPNFAIKRNFQNQVNLKYSQKNYIQQNPNNWVKIEVTESGIYKIDASQLSALGITIPQNEISTIQIFGNGGKMLSETVTDAPTNMAKEQEILVNTKQDGNLESIVFYGAPTKGFDLVEKNIRRYNNVYTASNYYTLTWGNAQGKRAYSEEISQTASKAPDSYYHRIFFEEEINNPYTKACGRSWFGRSIFTSPFVDLLHNLDRSKPILYRFSLAHRSNSLGVFKIFQNNNEIGKLSLRGISLSNYQHSYRDFLDLEVPSSQIPSDNRSMLKFAYSNSESPTASTGYLDYYEIHYPRSFYAIENELEFIADTTLKGLTEFTINGFSGDVIGFDISEISNPKLLFNHSKTGSIFVIKKDLNNYSLSKFYISGKLKSPKLSKISNSNILADDGSDVVLITDQSLINSANKYKEYRESVKNVKVKVVTTSSIYNEINGGTPDITAIRDYLSYVYANWAKSLKHIVIWGDGHFDYKGIQYKDINPFPAYESPDEYEHYFDERDRAYSTDDFFACVNGNDPLPDASFGRVTINTDTEGLAIVNKIKHYENNSSEDDWRLRIFLAADDGVGEYYDGDDHVEYSELLFKLHIPEKMISDRLYLVEYPAENVPGGKRKPLASEAMVSTLNTTGAVLWNYIGHGNPRVLAHEQWFNRDVHVAQLNNLNKLPFFTAATCDFGRFDDPEVKSGAEELFLSTTGGVIGVLSATRVVYGSQNASFNNLFFDIIFEHTEEGNILSLGEMIAQLKMTYSRLNDQKFFLLGDPLMNLNIPTYRTVIEKINQIPINDSTETILLEGLSKVEVEGYIYDTKSNKIDNSFNGTAYIMMFDGDIAKVAYDNVEYTDKFEFQKMGGALNRVMTKITDGKFKTSFVIPKDVSFSDSAGRLYAYSISDPDLSGKKKFGIGATRKFRVFGVSTTGIIDTKSPEISIFLDSRKFKDGDVVSGNPLLIVDLFDENGINMTGLGVGHLVEAWIDDNPNSINLTNELKTSFEKPNYSLIEKILYGIKPGNHKLKLRAWDVFNNYNIDSVFFTTLPSNSGKVNLAMCVPNPFYDDGTQVQFTHTIEPPVDYRINIFNALGSKVRMLEGKLTSYSIGEIPWDAKDDNGNFVSPGTYYIRIELENSLGSYANSSNLIGVFLK